MAIRHGIMASSFSAVPPSATIGSTTNYNQELATFNATVSANGSSTTVYFDYSTSSSFTTYSTVTVASPVTTNNASVYYNISVLLANTLYYVRVRAVSDGGTTTSGSTSFTTWSLKTATYTSSSTFTVPTVTPTGGSTVIPTIYSILVVGGGGGAHNNYYGGGGGGAYKAISSQAFNNSTSLSLTITVGGGGATSTNVSADGATGGTSSLTGSSFTTVEAVGGVGAPQNYNGSASGNPPANAGGTGGIALDLKGNGSIGAGGGGGGAGGTGGNATVGAINTVPTGGNGGAAYNSSVYSLNVAGGGAGGAEYNNSQGGNRGTIPASSYGRGGSGPVRGNGTVTVAATNGQDGVVIFKYYGA